MSSIDQTYDIDVLTRKNKHRRDYNITFKDEGHIYTLNVNNTLVNPKSTTTFIHSLFPHFDADKIIDKMFKYGSAKRKYPGMSKKQIKESWKQNGGRSAQLGTALHLAIEIFLNDTALNDKLDYKTTPELLNDINDSYPKRVNSDDKQETSHVFAKNSIGFCYFLSFWRDFLTKYPQSKIYRTEWLIYDEEALISGSIDCTVITPNNELVLIDWKRSKEIKYDNRYEKGYGLVSYLDNCNYNHYTLQLNIYRHILETKYNYKVIYMMLAIFHPNQKTYNCIPIKREESLTNKLWKYRLNQLTGKSVDDLTKGLNKVHI